MAWTGSEVPGGPSEHACGRWLFSHEEDGARVYVPRDTKLPPSRRPRDGFDIDPGGSFRAYVPGRGDGPVARDGRWEASGEVIAVRYDDGGTSSLTLVEASPGRLKVRRD